MLWIPGCGAPGIPSVTWEGEGMGGGFEDTSSGCGGESGREGTWGQGRAELGQDRTRQVLPFPHLLLRHELGLG